MVIDIDNFFSEFYRVLPSFTEFDLGRKWKATPWEREKKTKAKRVSFVRRVAADWMAAPQNVSRDRITVQEFCFVYRVSFLFL